VIWRALALGIASLGLMALSDGNRPPAFTVDAPQGKFDGWEASAAGYVGLRARITVLSLGPYGEWSPGITATIEGDRRSVGLMAYSQGDGWLLEVYAQLGLDDEDAGTTWFRTLLDPARPFSVELRWTREGQVCLTIEQAGKSESLLFALQEAPLQMGLYGSSGSYNFSEIEPIALPDGQNREAADAKLRAGCAPIS